MTDDLDLAALERWATGSDDTIYLLTREDATALLARLRAAEAVIDRYRRDVGQLVEERTAAEARVAILTDELNLSDRDAANAQEMARAAEARVMVLATELRLEVEEVDRQHKQLRAAEARVAELEQSNALLRNDLGPKNLRIIDLEAAGHALALLVGDEFPTHDALAAWRALMAEATSPQAGAGEGV
jgi:chromosome segregation ATPase